MVGPPGTGKTMLARRLPGILPDLDEDELLEASLIHSVAGVDEDAVATGERPFRAPHHTASIAGMIGGGNPPRPGEVSLAHRGVLFLDEMPEFGPAVLQSLRQPLEDQTVTLVRAEGRIMFPAAFSLVAAANPCPCGYLGDTVKNCACLESAISKYRNRIGGPLLDRIDLTCEVWRPHPSLMLSGAGSVSSSKLADDVRAARERISHRGPYPTSRLAGAALIRACGMHDHVIKELEHMAHASNLSGRGITRLLRVARTFADLEQSEGVCSEHLAEAFCYRCGAA
jgi:magnesium chelatase family protein